MRWYEYKMEADDLAAPDDLKAKLLAMTSQLTEEEFAKACAHTVDNSKDLDFTLSQLEKLLQM